MSILEAACDYLTLTAPYGASRDLYEWGQTYIKEEERRGAIPHAVTMKGGAVGWRAGRATAARARDWDLARQTGGLAAWVFVHDFGWPDDWRATRFDGQVTVRLQSATAVRAAILRHRDEARAANMLLPVRRRRKIVLFEADDGGTTLYIGARTSPKFYRIYDKGAESEEEVYENCVRYELELKKPYADKALRGFAGEFLPVGNRIAATVYKEFTRVGVQPDWTLQEQAQALGLDDAGAMSDADSEVARRLTWLADTVKPALRYLRQSGYTPEILEALGLLDTSEGEG